MIADEVAREQRHQTLLRRWAVLQGHELRIGGVLPPVARVVAHAGVLARVQEDLLQGGHRLLPPEQLGGALRGVHEAGAHGAGGPVDVDPRVELRLVEGHHARGQLKRDLLQVAFGSQRSHLVQGKHVGISGFEARWVGVASGWKPTSTSGFASARIATAASEFTASMTTTASESITTMTTSTSESTTSMTTSS